MMNQACLRGNMRTLPGESRTRYTVPNEFGHVHFQANMTIDLNSKAKVAPGGS